MNYVVGFAYNSISEIIDPAAVLDVVSSTAQAVLFSNSYLLAGAAVIGTGMLLYTSIQQGRVETPPREPMRTALIAQTAERAISTPRERRVEITSDDGRYQGEWLNGEWDGRGVFISVEGDTYEGEFKNGQSHGVGRHKTAGGEEYLGEFKEGEYDGVGTLKWPDGTKYVGEFQEGELHGFGRYDSEEISYEGQLEHGEFQGHGDMYTLSGLHYTGQFVNGDWNGHGVLVAEDGITTYAGSFVNNQKHGVGVISYPDGSFFAGEFAENQKHGAGIQTYAKGEDGSTTIIEGFYRRGERHGECRKISTNCNIDQRLYYNNGAIVNTNRENIKDPIFFYQLFGIKEGTGITRGYSLGIMADYLENKFQDEPEILQRVVNPLKQAAAFCEIPVDQVDQKLEEMAEGLKQGHSYLLPYGRSGHSTLLNLVPTPDGQFVDCEIYNSGDGLTFFHRADANSGKYELMTKYRVPIEEMDINVLQKVAKKDDFSLVDSSYLLFSDISGATRIDSEDPIWKRPQKAGNCELECISAFFAQNAPHVYKSARKDLFQDCKDAAQANKAAFGGRDVNTFPRVQHKTAKLDLH